MKTLWAKQSFCSVLKSTRQEFLFTSSVFQIFLVTPVSQQSLEFPETPNKITIGKTFPKGVLLLTDLVFPQHTPQNKTTDTNHRMV